MTVVWRKWAGVGLAALFLGMSAPAVQAQGPLEVKVVTRETHSLWYFLQCLRGNPHQSRQLSEHFWKLHPKSSADASALDDLEQVLGRPEWQSITFPGDGPRHRKLADVLEVESLQARDVEDLIEHCQALLNVEDSRKVAHALRHFAPLFHDLIWLPSSVELEKQAEEMRALMKESQMGRELAAARRLYASSWPADRPFSVVLVPIPRTAGQEFNTFGHSDSFLEVIEMPSGSSVRPQIGVAFHELCHAFWATRSEAQIEALRKNFYALGEGGRYAYDQLNEALATTLGNGWFQGLVDGKLATIPWYSDDIIDVYARALNATVVQLLTEKFPLDRAFATRAVQIFLASFPRYAEDCNIVMREIILISNLPAVHRGEFQNKLSTLQFVRTIYGAHELSGESTRQTLRAHPYTTRVFLIRPEQRRTLQEAYGFPNLPERGSLTQKKNDVWHVVVVATGSEDFVRFLLELSRKRYLQSALIGPNP